MHDELAEIRDFVAEYPPFDGLDPAGLDKFARRLVIRYLRRGTPFPPPGQAALWLIRQGAVELRQADGALARRLGEGDQHDAACLPDSPESAWQGRTTEDTLVYGLPKAELDTLWAEHPELHRRAIESLGQRLRHSRLAAHQAPERDTGSLPLARLVARPPVCARPDTTVRAAAEQMTRERVSALLVVDGEQLCGIVTDRDLRSRCLAAGLPESTPLSTVMTPDPLTLPPEAAGFEALLTMTGRGIHHLPVTHHGRLLGLISSTDLLRAQGVSSVHLADRIRRAADLGQLAVLAGELPELWLNLARRGDNASILGRIVSCIGDALAARLLALAEARRGPPPVPYAWIAYGSQGRQELTLHSDQDNALILADSFDPSRHASYFDDLAREVCDGLAACGFTLCPGAMMAANVEWRKTASGWRVTFADWIMQTAPQKARLATNLFDFRVIHGDDSLGRPLREQISEQAPHHETLFAHLVSNSCSSAPPLGFFRQLVVISEGEHAGQLDLKRHGILPIVDLVRIHALAAGCPETGTLARLRAVAGSQRLSQDGAETLASAFECLLALRTRHQQEQLEHGLLPDNFANPAQLSAGDRHNLRDIFATIATQQNALRLAFPHTLIR